MKKILLLTIMLISTTFEGQIVKVNIDGNYQISGVNTFWWTYRYRPLGATTYFTSSIQSATPSLVKLNPFLTYELSRNFYNTFGQPTSWETDILANNEYQTITPKTVGYTYNFNQQDIVEGWRGYRLENTTTTNYSNIQEMNSNLTSVTGESLNLTWSNNYGLMLVSPKIADLSTDKKFSIYALSSQGNCTIQLGTITNPYDSSTFHPLKTINLNGSIGFQKVEVFMNNYIGNDNHIAIKTSGSNGNVYFDNFAYEQSVNCLENSNLSYTNLTEEGALVSFDTPINQNVNEINVKNLQTQINQTFTTTNNFFLIQGLSGNTSYEVKVRGYCAEGLYSNWTTPINFTTPCSQITSGYNTSFGEYNYFNPCWKKILNGSEIYQSSSYGTLVTPRTGINMIRMNNSSLATTQKSYLISPYILDLDNNKRVKFFLISSGNYVNNSLTIGTMSNPTDESTFIPLKTISPLEMNEVNGFEVNTYWKEHIVYLDNYIISNNHHYIALKQNNLDTNSVFFIDDFTYESIPSCTEPTNLKTIKTTFSTAKIEWTNNFNNSNEWQIEYGVKGFVLGNGIQIDITNNLFATLNNLASYTEYDFYIRSKCGNTYSNWSDRGYFKTKCEGVNIGFTDNYENGEFDLNTCWSRCTAKIREPYFSPNIQLNYSSTEHYSGLKSINLNHSGSYHPLNDISKIILVSPRLIDLNNERIISFWGKLTSSAGLIAIQFGTLSDPDNYLTFTPYKNLTNLSQNQWAKYSVDMSDYYGTDEFVGIRLVGNNGYSYFFYIDDFEYKLNECTKPSGLSATQVDSNSASLNWNTNNSNIINCQIEYGVKGFALGTGTLISATTNQIIISGLNPNTSYQYRVRNICNNTNWSELYDFKICCVLSCPYYENFDQYQNTNVLLIPDICWTTNENADEGLYVNIFENYITDYTSSPNSIRIYNNGTTKDSYLISPFIEDFNNNKKLKFWILGQDHSLPMSISIGTIKNPLDISTYEEYQQLTLNDVPLYGKEVYIDFSNYQGSNKMFAIKMNKTSEEFTQSFVYIDDLILSEKIICKEPVNIHFSQITNNSTKIIWDDTMGENIQIEYGLQGFIIGTGTILTTNQNEILVSDLNPSNNYEFYFKIICNDSNSELIGPKKITTTCIPYQTPWLENFSQLTTYGSNILPNCMNVIQPGFETKNSSLYIPNTSYWGSNHTLTGNGDTNYLWLNQGNPIITSPPFSLTAGICYMFKLDARIRYEYSSNSIRIGIGRGVGLHYIESYLFRNGTLSEYNYNTNSFTFTPLESGVYTFTLLGISSPTDYNMLIDNLKIDEGYQNIISSPVIFSSNFNNSTLLLEKPEKSNIITTNISGDQKLLMLGSTSEIQYFDNNVWSKNQSSISKINFKVNTSSINPLVLKFDLKQTYNTTNEHSLFRVVVNGNQISNIIKPVTSNNDEFVTYQFDLTSFSNNNIYISLQHLGKLFSGTGDNALVDNIEITNTLSNENFYFDSLKVYPIPSKEIIHVSNNVKINEYEIVNSTGQLIEKNKIDKLNFTLNIEKLSKGIYFLKLNSESNYKTIKIVKQ